MKQRTQVNTENGHTGYAALQTNLNCQQTWLYRTLKVIKGKSLLTQPAITCSKLTIETVEQGVKYVQS